MNPLETIDRAVLREGLERLGADGWLLFDFHGLNPVAARLLHQTIPMGEGVIGWVAANRRAVIVNDPVRDDRHATEFAANVGVQPRHRSHHEGAVRGTEVRG